MSLDDYMRQNMLTGTQSSGLDKPISFADIMRQIDGPWGFGATVPHHFRSCELVMGEQRLVCECGVPRRDYTRTAWQSSGTGFEPISGETE